MVLLFFSSYLSYFHMSHDSFIICFANHLLDSIQFLYVQATAPCCSSLYYFLYISLFDGFDKLFEKLS